MLLPLRSTSIHSNSIAHTEPPLIPVPTRHHPQTHTRFVLPRRQKPSGSRSRSCALPKSPSAANRKCTWCWCPRLSGVTKRGPLSRVSLLLQRPQQKAARCSGGHLIHLFQSPTRNIPGKKTKISLTVQICWYHVLSEGHKGLDQDRDQDQE